MTFTHPNAWTLVCECYSFDSRLDYNELYEIRQEIERVGLMSAAWPLVTPMVP